MVSRGPDISAHPIVQIGKEFIVGFDKKDGEFVKTRWSPNKGRGDEIKW
jgi:hypothetical protein